MNRGYLPDIMRARADRDGLCADHPVRVAYEEVEAAMVDPLAPPSAVRKLAREMREVWRKYSGESLWVDGARDA